MPLCVCGRISDDDARYCRDCGRSLDPLGQQEVLVLDPEAPRSSTTVLRRGGWDRRHWLPLLAALGAVGLLAVWSIAAGPDEEPTGGRPESEPSSTTAEPATRATTATPETTGATPGTTGGSGATTSLGRVAAGGDGGPLGPAGLDLLIATTGRPARLDLDTGAVTYSEGDRVFPIAVRGSWVIVEGYTEGIVARLPLDDLAAEPQPLVAGEDIGFATIISSVGGVDPSQIWVSVTRQTGESASGLTTALYLVDLDTGAILDEQAADAYPSPGSLLAWTGATHRGLVTGPAGGVYEVTDEGYRLVTEGRALAADDDRALVQTCDARLVCTLTWLDRRSWRPLDLVVPDAPDAGLAMVPGTDWLLITRFGPEGAGPADLLDIETGQVVEIDAKPLGFGGPATLPAISPGGRWLAEHGDDPRTIVLRELTSGEVVEIPLDEAASGPLFFIED